MNGFASNTKVGVIVHLVMCNSLQDFEVDVDLRQMMEDFLRQLVYKNYSEEVELAQQLLE